MRRLRTALILFALFAVVAASAAYAFWHRVAPEIELRMPLDAGCVVSAPAAAGPSAPAAEPVALNGEQMANAATITAVGIRRGVPRRAVVVALATAWQESKLLNLSGGDRDSIGLFQQRPSQGWGRPDQIADPRYSAGRFYTSLLKVRNWQKMRVTDAAQAVQRSAYPELYEQWAPKSEVMASALVGEVTGAVACTILGEPSGRGAQGIAQLAASMRLDWGDLRTSAGATGLTVTAKNATTGWQYAHWLVAHAEDHAIKRVRYGEQEWTRQGGAWQKTTQSSGTSSGFQVVAEVY